MLGYIVKRIVLMVPTMIGISMISFLIIQLPPGDYLTSVLAQMSDQGQTLTQAEVERLRVVYGLDQSIFV